MKKTFETSKASTYQNLFRKYFFKSMLGKSHRYFLRAMKCKHFWRYRNLKQYSDNVHDFVHEVNVVYILYLLTMVFLLHCSAIYQQKLQYQPKLTTNTSQNMSTVKLLFSVLDTHCFNLYRQKAEKNWFFTQITFLAQVIFWSMPS